MTGVMASRNLLLIATLVVVASQASATLVDDPQCAQFCDESLFGEDCQSCSLTTFLTRDDDFFGVVGEATNAIWTPADSIDLRIQKGDDDKDDDDDGSNRRRSRNEPSNKGCTGFDEEPDIGKGEKNDMKDRRRDAKKKMRLAKRYGEKARVVYLGDSITRDWGNDSKCTKNIYSHYDKRGLNFGIGQLTSRGLVALVDWIFGETDLAPQLVWIAIGINDCQADNDYPVDLVVDAIIRTIKAVKYYSPQTAVVWQEILPADDDKKDWEGDKFKHQDLYDCVRKTNEKVREWVDKQKDKCISHVSFEDFILKKGKFREDVLGDGVHFTDGGDMDKYCELIEDATRGYDKYEVQARSTGLEPWRDVEPFHYEEEGETYYRWKYNDWSNCTGACGSQRRTVECHRFEPNATSSYTVEDPFCEDVFMNPLERVCDLTEKCLQRLEVPASALVHQPNTFVVNSPTARLAMQGEACPSFSPLSAVLTACCVALGLLLIISTSILICRAKADRQAAAAEATLKLSMAPATTGAIEALQPASGKLTDVEVAESDNYEPALVHRTTQ
mmetsp:Transcript_31670/g.89993  ORF Transcript_31670/g.89993 Transcript_31670/m.89993 type:complete len:558 (+) Transcript_31670:75-1748(+)